MQRHKYALILLVVVCTGIGFIGELHVRAAPQASQAVNDPIVALLAEVRLLRLAMEQSAAVGPRVQLTLARLNIQEQRTAHLGADLDGARRELGQLSLKSRQLADEVEDIERRQLPAAADPQRRKQLEDVQAALKFELARMTVAEQQLRTRENEAAQLLSTEQARWIDLNARLDELERLLGPVRH